MTMFSSKAFALAAWLLVLTLICASCSFVNASDAATEPQFIDEHIVLTGGPARRFFEHGKLSSHDMYWFNFVDASEIWLRNLSTQLRPGEALTWIVYQPGYVRRGSEMQKNLCAEIAAKAAKLNVRLVWFQAPDELIRYLNRGMDRHHVKIASFDYFGHSNKACFLFDYSNDIDGLSIAYLHVDDLKKINSDIFAQNAVCKSWGCHSGEMYSQWWKGRFHVYMTGANGKTDFAKGGLPILSGDSATWVQ